jgi:hypothetical protein
MTCLADGFLGGGLAGGKIRAGELRVGGEKGKREKPFSPPAQFSNHNLPARILYMMLINRTNITDG